jgi:hypothetical protein
MLIVIHPVNLRPNVLCTDTGDKIERPEPDSPAAALTDFCARRDGEPVIGSRHGVRRKNETKDCDNISRHPGSVLLRSVIGVTDQRLHTIENVIGNAHKFQTDFRCDFRIQSSEPADFGRIVALLSSS